MPSIHLATEDELSEAVGLRLIAELDRDVNVDLKFRKGGNGYLRSKIANFNEISKRIPILILTDLDSKKCPKLLIDDWIEKKHDQLYRPESLGQTGSHEASGKN